MILMIFYYLMLLKEPFKISSSFQNSTNNASSDKSTTFAFGIFSINDMLHIPPYIYIRLHISLYRRRLLACSCPDFLSNYQPLP